MIEPACRRIWREQSDNARVKCWVLFQLNIKERKIKDVLERHRERQRETERETERERERESQRERERERDRERERY